MTIDVVENSFFEIYEAQVGCATVVFVRDASPKVRSAIGIAYQVVQPTEAEAEVPESFTQGLRDIVEGRVVSMEQALRDAPKGRVV